MRHKANTSHASTPNTLRVVTHVLQRVATAQRPIHVNSTMSRSESGGGCVNLRASRATKRHVSSTHQYGKCEPNTTRINVRTPAATPATTPAAAPATTAGMLSCQNAEHTGTHAVTQTAVLL